jgi:hypothetical protein
MFPTWPSKSERCVFSFLNPLHPLIYIHIDLSISHLHNRTVKRNASPSAPQAIHGHGQEEEELGGLFNHASQESTGFRLKV